MRGLTRSLIALIVPPLPAPSRPSKRIQTRRPLWTTHCWSLTSFDVQAPELPLVSLALQLTLAFARVRLGAGLWFAHIGALNHFVGAVPPSYQNADAEAGL
jgi:hypothetical protein